MKIRRLSMAAPRQAQSAVRSKANDLLRNVLRGCEINALQSLVLKSGGTIVLSDHIRFKLMNDVRPKRALACTDGRQISIQRHLAPNFHEIWAAAHCFAHMIQWQAASPSPHHDGFRIGGNEAQRWSTIRLHELSGSKLERAIRQELEAHYLTAAILAASYGDVSVAQLIEAAMEKAYEDLFLLSLPGHKGRARAAHIWRIFRRFYRSMHGIPRLNGLPQFRKLRGNFIPYLLVSR